MQTLTQQYMYVTLTLGHQQLHSDDLNYSYEPRSKSNHLAVSPTNRGYLKWELNAKLLKQICLWPSSYISSNFQICKNLKVYLARYQKALSNDIKIPV